MQNTKLKIGFLHINCSVLLALLKCLHVHHAPIHAMKHLHSCHAQRFLVLYFICMKAFLDIS